MLRRPPLVFFGAVALIALVGVVTFPSLAQTVTPTVLLTPVAATAGSRGAPPPPWDLLPGQSFVQNPTGVVAVKAVAFTAGQIVVFYAARIPTHPGIRVTVTTTQRECVPQPAPSATQVAIVLPLGQLGDYDVGAIQFAYDDLPGQVIALSITGDGDAALVDENGALVVWHLEPIRQTAPDIYRTSLTVLEPYSLFHYDERQPELPEVTFVTQNGVRGGQSSNIYTGGGYFQLTTGMVASDLFVTVDTEGTVSPVTERGYSALLGTPVPTHAPSDPSTATPYPATPTALGFMRMRQPVPVSCS